MTEVAVCRNTECIYNTKESSGRCRKDKITIMKFQKCLDYKPSESYLKYVGKRNDTSN